MTPKFDNYINTLGEGMLKRGAIRGARGAGYGALGAAGGAAAGGLAGYAGSKLASKAAGGIASYFPGGGLVKSALDAVEPITTKLGSGAGLVGGAAAGAGAGGLYGVTKKIKKDKEEKGNE